MLKTFSIFLILMCLVFWFSNTVSLLLYHRNKREKKKRSNINKSKRYILDIFNIIFVFVLFCGLCFTRKKIMLLLGFTKWQQILRNRFFFFDVEKCKRDKEEAFIEINMAWLTDNMDELYGMDVCVPYNILKAIDVYLIMITKTRVELIYYVVYVTFIQINVFWHFYTLSLCVKIQSHTILCLQ